LDKGNLHQQFMLEGKEAECDKTSELDFKAEKYPILT
jgi:hypothetical protein